MGKEIEMKLLTTRAGCHRLFAARTVTKTALPVTEKRLSLKNIYYDTKDGALNRERMAYRVRVTNGSAYEATIKTKGTSTGGFSVRGEYTVPLKDETACDGRFSSRSDEAPEGPASWGITCSNRDDHFCAPRHGPCGRKKPCRALP